MSCFRSFKYCLCVACSLLALSAPCTAWAEGESFAFAQKIRQTLETPSPEMRGSYLNLAEWHGFYEDRVFAPAWQAGIDWKTGALTDPAPLEAFLSTFRDNLTANGLEETGYPLALIESYLKNPTPDHTVAIDALMTAALLKLGHTLHGDDIDLSLLYPGWAFHSSDVDVAELLETSIENNDIKGYLTALSPTDPAYRDLSRLLMTYKALKPWPRVSTGPSIRLGDTDPRLPDLRARLLAEGYAVPAPSADNAPYDAALEEAVKAYQIRNGLKPDGVIGAKTVEIMNIPLAARLAQIKANMERMRHMPRSMPPRYVRVNIPDYMLEIVEDGKVVYRDSVMVGRVDRKTPFIQSAIRSVIFNPSWHVPASIAKKDILPKLRKDPHYLEKMGFVVNGSATDPHGAAIDWHKVSASEIAKFRLRQTPGDGNSLGRLKFDFDNDFAVYMHGTPHQELFSKSARAFSSGCVRVKDPEVFATYILKGTDGDWPVSRVQDSIDQQKTRWLKVSDPLPLFFEYWTVLARSDDGPGLFRTDLYDYDRLILKAMEEAKASKRAQAAKVSAPPIEVN